jgi:hypothetical protein
VQATHRDWAAANFGSPAGIELDRLAALALAPAAAQRALDCDAVLADTLAHLFRDDPSTQAAFVQQMTAWRNLQVRLFVTEICGRLPAF